MQRRSLPAFVIGVGLVVFLISSATAQATEGKMSFASSSGGISISPAIHRWTSSASPAPGSVISTTFATYLPMVSNLVILCSVDPTQTPTLISPANGSTLTTLIPTYQWIDANALKGNLAYVDIAKDPGFTQPVYSVWSDPVPGTDQFQAIHNLDPAITYYWHARFDCPPNLHGGTWAHGPWSATWSFVAGSGGTILPAPMLIAPWNGATISSTEVTLQWLPVSGATQYILWWNQLGVGLHFYRVTGTQITRPLNPDAMYTWSVSAQNDYALSPRSAIWQFTTFAGAASRSSEPVSDGIINGDGGTIVIER